MVEVHEEQLMTHYQTSLAISMDADVREVFVCIATLASCLQWLCDLVQGSASSACHRAEEQSRVGIPLQKVEFG